MRQPRKRRRFRGPGDELNYLNDMVAYFVCEEKANSEAARPFLQRFGELLKQAGSDDGSIMLQDHWALFHEALGGIPKAIMHREREIALIEDLFAIGGPVGPVNGRFLAKTMHSLVRDYLQAGEREKANQLVRRIEQGAHVDG
jgi:hypothetical protein